MINESVRGKDLYLLVDVTNYNIKYSLCGHENRMSPDDHYSDLKRIIAAVAEKQDVSTSSCRSSMKAVSINVPSASLSTVLLLYRNSPVWALKIFLHLLPMIPVYRTQFH